jgi:GNAT superfamily N-acetyltransferase
VEVATLPKFRRQGIHAALISERLKLAIELGCTAATGQADAGSTSQCNQQRAGLSIVHTKCIWTNQPSKM